MRRTRWPAEMGLMTGWLRIEKQKSEGLHRVSQEKALSVDVDVDIVLSRASPLGAESIKVFRSRMNRRAKASLHGISRAVIAQPPAIPDGAARGGRRRGEAAGLTGIARDPYQPASNNRPPRSEPLLQRMRGH